MVCLMKIKSKQRAVRKHCRAIRKSDLDGSEAAAELEADRVMRAFGWTAGSWNRAILKALRVRMREERCSAAAAGDLAIRRWGAYVEAGPHSRLILPKAFFRSGLWLIPYPWPFEEGKLHCGKPLYRRFISQCLRGETT